MKTKLTVDLGNNESLTRAISRNADGTFTAVTFTASRNFKTHKGAVKWMAERMAK